MLLAERAPIIFKNVSMSESEQSTEKPDSEQSTDVSDAEQDEADLQNPPGGGPDFWMDSEYSDVSISLVMPAIPGAHEDTCNAEGTVWKEIPAHKLMLKKHSTYFKGLFTTGQEITAQPAAKRRRIQVTRSMAEEEQHTIDISCEDEAAAAATESVLEFLYKSNMPASANFSMLYKMMVVADYLGADACVKACAVAISHLTGFVEEDVPQFSYAFDMLGRCSASNPAVVARLQKAYFNYLLTTYKVADDIVKDTNLLLSFRKLPLNAIKAWGSSDDIMADSENSVVVLLNDWWQSQPEAARTQSCKEALSGLVRPAYLTSDYLMYALDQLEWYIPPFPGYKEACRVIKARRFGRPGEFEPFNKLVQERDYASNTKLRLKWYPSLEHVHEVSGRSTDRCLQGPGTYWQGHIWSLYLEVSGANETQNVGNDGITITIGVQMWSANSMPQGLTASAWVEYPDPHSRADCDSEDDVEYSKYILFTNAKSRGELTVSHGKDLMAALKNHLTSDALGVRIIAHLSMVK